MNNYHRIILGSKSTYAEEAYKGRFVGVDFGIERDLTSSLPDNWKDFNREFIPVYLQRHPDRSKVSAGLACGLLWTVAKGLQIGDRVLCPDGQGKYFVGEVIGGYEYHKDQLLPHRRAVRWFSGRLTHEVMSESLRNSLKSFGTVINISKHAQELEDLVSGKQPLEIIVTDDTIEDPHRFVLEKHLEDFLVHNWKATELGKRYKLFEEDGEIVGQQYPSDTGLIDILAISKDRKELLVVELKKGRASDTVIGQIQRYMGYVKDELAEPGQIVRGAIIAFEDEVRLNRALSVTQNIDFYTYRVHFELHQREDRRRS